MRTNLERSEINWDQIKEQNAATAKKLNEQIPQKLEVGGKISLMLSSQANLSSMEKLVTFDYLVRQVESFSPAEFETVYPNLMGVLTRLSLECFESLEDFLGQLVGTLFKDQSNPCQALEDSLRKNKLPRFINFDQFISKCSSVFLKGKENN